MTVQDVCALDLPDAGRLCLLVASGMDRPGTIRELAKALNWREAKTRRVVRLLESSGHVEVSRQGSAAQIVVSIFDHPACTGSEPECTVPTEQSVQTEPPTEKPPESDTELRTRLEAIAFRGIGWVLRTFPHDVVNEHLTVVEDLVREGVSYSPAGLLNAALRGKCPLFRIAKPTQSDSNSRSPGCPVVDTGPPPDTGISEQNETQRRFYRDYWEEFRTRRTRYPMDHNAGYQVPDTYERHAREGQVGDPAAGIRKMKAGLGV